jgi:hypothetical protein
MAFEQARNGAEMMEYDSQYRYGDFICGTPFVGEDYRVEMEIRANGTWVEPPRKRVLGWECRGWGICLRAWPWLWNFIELDWEEL